MSNLGGKVLTVGEITVFTGPGRHIRHKKMVEVERLLRPVCSDCEESLDSSCVYV